MLKNDKYKLGIIGISLVVVLIALSGVICVGEITEKVINQNKMHVEEVTLQISENISNRIQSYLHNLNLIAKNLLLNENITNEEINKILRFEIEEGLFSEIVVVDLEGRGKDSNNREIYIGDREYFKNTAKGIVSVSEPLDSKIYDDNIIVYSIPLILEGKIVGVVCGINNSDLVKTQLDTSIYKNQGCSYIINQSGNLILESHIDGEDEYGNKDNAIHDFFDDMRMNLSNKSILETGSAIKYLYGEQKYVAYSKIKSTDDWYFITAVPTSNVFIDAQKTIEITVIILIVSILAFIIIGLYLIISSRNNKEKLDKAVYEDHLTEINNYEKFMIDGEIYLNERNKNSCIVVVFDIEKFKVINDMYGYQVGDSILKNISKNLQQYFGDSAVYGRLTGDTFGLLTEIYDKDNEIQHLIYKIKKEIISLDNLNLNIKIGLSIGIYIVEEHKEDLNIKRIVDNADMARFKSKSMQQIDYLMFDENMKEEKKIKMMIEQDLLYAIKKEQFEIYYQPKFDIITKQIIGSEALIRWIHPTMGVVSPIKFIPIAEKDGFINEIGNWVFNDVCKTLRNIIDEGVKVVPVSVNLSRVELYQEDLIKFLDRTLKKYNIPAELVELEITETTTLNDMNFISDKIYKIKDLGIKVAMDDFGVGNSNLSNLKDIPMDVLKIDRSILIDIETNIKTKVVIESILHISNHLNLEVICEGVENMEQVEILKNMGCKVIQGYVFSKPIDRNQYRNILINSKEVYPNE